MSQQLDTSSPSAAKIDPAFTSQRCGGQRKRSHSLSHETEESKATIDDDSQDEEDPVEVCKRMVPRNPRTKMLINQLEIFQYINLRLQQKRSEKETENPSQPTPGSISDSSTVKGLSLESSSDEETSVLSSSEPHDELNASINTSNIAIFVHAEPPVRLWEEIIKIISRPLPNYERARLRHIAIRFHNVCLNAIRYSFNKGEVENEDASLDSFRLAFKSIAHKGLEYSDHEELCGGLHMVHEKEQDFDNSYFSKIDNSEKDNEINVESGQPCERHEPSNARAPAPMHEPHASTPPAHHLSPVSAMDSEKRAKRYSVKLPLAGLSEATALTSFVTKFSSSRSSVISACTSIDWVRDPFKARKLKAKGKPFFEPVPAGTGLYKIKAPFMFIEGKAYVGNKQLNEFENRTAAFGALALRSQNMNLENLLRKQKDLATRSDDFSTPILFSIAIQGPVHELWVHWVIEEHEVYTFQSKLVGCFNTLLLQQTEDLMVQCNNIARWGSGGFMNLVLKQLSDRMASNLFSSGT